MHRTTSRGARGSWQALSSLALGAAMLGLAVLNDRWQRARHRPARDGHAGAASPFAPKRRPSAPGIGWLEMVRSLWRKTGEDRILLIAAGVTYYALLALFPAIAALVSLFGLFADPGVIGQQLSGLSGVLPDGALQVVGDQIRRIQAHGGGTLGAYFLVGLGFSLWSANAGTKSLFDALNVVHGEREERTFLRFNLQSLAFTLGAIVFVSLAAGTIVILPAAFALIGLESLAASAVALARWPLLLIIMMLGLALIYRYGPSRPPMGWRWISWGSGTATVLWLAGSMLFSWYVASFGSFNRTYGSLGAAVGFMIWIWLSVVIVLVGAEIDAVLDDQGKQRA